MRVAFFDFVTHFGGAQRSTIELAIRMRSVMDVCIWDAYGACPEYVTALEKNGLSAFVLLPDATFRSIGLSGRPVRRLLRFARSLPEQRRLVQRLHSRFTHGRPDLVWTNSLKGFIALTAAGPRQIPLVYFLRGGEDALPSPAVVKRLLRPRAARVFVLTESIGSLLTGHGYPEHRISVVPNAISVEDVIVRAKRPPCRDLPQQHRRVRLLIAATLVPNKGQLEGVRVLQRLVAKGHDAVLYLAGDTPVGAPSGDYAQSITRLAETLGVRDRVEFLGWRSDALSVLRQCSVLLVLSASEGVPRVILEAMAVGVPVVATSVGGVADQVIDRKTGWIVSRDDIDGVVTAVLEATASGLSTSVVSTARDYVAHGFSPERQLESAVAAFAAARSARVR